MSSGKRSEIPPTFQPARQMRALWAGSNASIATMRHTSNGWARIMITPWTTPTNRRSWATSTTPNSNTTGSCPAFTKKRTNTLSSRKALAEKWPSSKYAIRSALSRYSNTWSLFQVAGCRHCPSPGIQRSSAGSTSTLTRLSHQMIGCIGPATVRIGMVCAPNVIPPICARTTIRKTRLSTPRGPR